MARRRPALTPELRAEKRIEYQQCHALAHRWDPIPVTTPPQFGAAIDLRCENCGTVRRDILSRVSGQLLARYYDYPEEYHDYERHDKAWWRSAWLGSMMIAKRDHVDITNEKVRSTNMRPRKYAEVLPAPRKRGPGRPPQPRKRASNEAAT